MGLTKEVRDFFTTRITALLDAKIKQAGNVIDEDKVLSAAKTRFCKKWGISLKNLERWEKIQKEKKVLDAEEDEIETIVYKSVNQATEGHGRYYNSNCVSAINGLALQNHREEVVRELYPAVVPQIEKLQKIKDDIQGVVMLATTETRLRNRLTAVLQKYGGDIKELLDYVPEEDF